MLPDEHSVTTKGYCMLPDETGFPLRVRMQKKETAFHVSRP